MNREQFLHVLRAASRIVVDAEPIVIGSQSILGSHDDAVLPIEAIRSIEVDIAFRNDADEAKADRIDGAIGELSQFHQSFGYYGQGVSLATAVLPDGWEGRLVVVDIEGESAVASCLEPHDCVISKLVADRPKDREFAAALLRTAVVDPAVLAERIALLPDRVSEGRRSQIRDWVRRQD